MPSVLEENAHVFLERDLLVACWGSTEAAAWLSHLDEGDIDDFAARAALRSVRSVLKRGADVSLPVVRLEMVNSKNKAAFETLSRHWADSQADTYGAPVIRSLLQQVQHEACIRRCRLALRDLGQLLASASGMTPQDIQGAISQRLAQAFTTATKGQAVHLRDALQELADRMADIEHAHREGEAVMVKLSTGLEPIDRASKGGLGAGQPVIIAGRPSTGKSSLARQIALELARWGTVYYWSGEMSYLEIAECVAAHRLRRPSEDLRAVPVYGLAEAQDCPQLVIDDKSVRSVGQLASRIEFFALQHKLSAVVIDYFGLACKAKDASDIGLEMKELVRLAKDLQIPVVILVQLNRDEKLRQDKRPVLTDLRGSGDIEQDAHVVWMLHKPSVYDPNADPEYVELWQRKHRTGPRDVCIKLSWDGETTTFGRWWKDEFPGFRSDQEMVEMEF